MKKNNKLMKILSLNVFGLLIGGFGILFGLNRKNDIVETRADDSVVLFRSQFNTTRTISTKVSGILGEIGTIDGEYTLSGIFSYIRNTTSTGVSYSCVVSATYTQYFDTSSLFASRPITVTSSYAYTYNTSDDSLRRFQLRLNQTGTRDIYTYISINGGTGNASLKNVFYYNTSHSSSANASGTIVVTDVVGSVDNPGYINLFFENSGTPPNFYWFDLTYTPTDYQTGYNSGYDIGFDEGYDLGYDTGYGNGNDDGYNNGYSYGYDVGFQAAQEQASSDIQSAYQQGFSDGYDDAYDVNTTATTIFSGILQVALVPINVFLGMFNFEILGINLGAFIQALFTIGLTIIVVKVVVGSGGKGD